MRAFSFLLFAVLAFGARPSFAAKFANQFVEFELPPQWQCNLEGAEWVCQSTSESKKRDAIIVLAAKLAGPQDSLDQYRNYLKAPKTFTSVQGKPVKSEMKYTNDVNLNGHAWVDSLHLESEIPGFYTRYLATVKQDIGVLVTYSINKAKYQQYLGDFETMVKTLKVFRKPGAAINTMPSSGNIFQQTTVPANIQENSVFPNTVPVGGSDNQNVQRRPNLPTGMILLIAAVIGFIIWRRRRNSGL